MIVKFSGSSCTNLNDKDYKINITYNNIKEIFIYIYNNITDEFTNSNGFIKDGVLCLVDDSDWELFDCYNVDISKIRIITLINTIHGG